MRLDGRWHSHLGWPGILLALGYIFGCVLATGNAVEAQGPEDVRHTPAASAVIASASRVRSLPEEQAVQGMPVHIAGIITAVSGYPRSFFIQDATGGVDVENSDIEVQVGDRVDLSGKTGPGFFAPIVVATHVSILGPGRLPLPRKAGNAELIGGQQDSQWIEVEGIVHSAEPLVIYGRNNLVLSLDVGGGTLRVILQQFEEKDTTALVDSSVRLRGVCISDFNEKRQYIGAGLIVSRSSDVAVVQPGAADPFSVPTTSIRNVLQFGRARHRVKISGVVTYQLPGRYVYVQTGGDGIRVKTASPLIVQVGQWVQAVGFPQAGEHSPILSDGFVRALGQTDPVEPVAIQAAKVIIRPGEFTRIDYDEQLVQLRGEVLESRVQEGQRIWTMSEDGKTFEASLLSPVGDEGGTDNLRAGSVLLLTGVCVVHGDFDRTPTSFSILLRSPRDILVLKRSSWWTNGHLLMLTVVLASAILLAGVWVATLRIRVRHQTRTIFESEQKFRYLATHDGLTGLMNRDAVIAELTTSLEASRGRSTNLCVVVIDLDHFKSVNDTYGHPAGDAVLREAAARLKASIRETDLIGRYGGEEFLVVLRGLNEMISPSRCERIRQGVCDKPVMVNGKSLTITCSIGSSSWPHIGATSEELIAEADHALYVAKENGRNRVEFFSVTSRREELEYSA